MREISDDGFTALNSVAAMSQSGRVEPLVTQQVHRLIATPKRKLARGGFLADQLNRSLVGRLFALGLLRQPDELRHDDGGIEHSEQGGE